MIGHTPEPARTKPGDAPKPTLEDLRAGAHDRRLVAVSIDTSVFDAQGLRLDGPLLRRLSIFATLRAGIGVRLLLSEIVVAELRTHLSRKVADSGDRLTKALRERAEALGASYDELELPAGLGRVVDPEIEATRQIDAFVAATAAVIVPFDGVPPSEVLRRYFLALPPFAEDPKKKHEFPDAFALLSLEAEAAGTIGGIIVCVSRDKGWHAFAKASPSLVATDDLAGVLDLFNATGRATAARLLADLREGRARELATEVESAVDGEMENFDVALDWTSSVNAEPGRARVGLVNLDWASALPARVVGVNADGTVSFMTMVMAKLSVETDFSLAVRDSVDRETISLGSVSIYTTVTEQLSVTITVSPHEHHDGHVSGTENGEFELLSVEVSDLGISLDLGEVEPF